MKISKIEFNNLKLISGNYNLINKNIFQNINKNPLIISHMNLYNLYKLRNKCKLKQLIQNNCYIILDGIALKLGLRLLGYNVNYDLNGTDLLPYFLYELEKRSLSLFLLGAKQGVVKIFKKKIQKEFLNLNIVGYCNGYKDIGQIIQKIQMVKPEVIIVSMGFLKQEYISVKYLKNSTVKVIWNVGGLFDTISAYKPRAPYYFRKLRLEWLYRFLLEPKRMWDRVFLAPIWLISEILKIKFSL